MSAVKRAVERGIRLTRALRHCGASRQAYYYEKGPVEHGIDMAIAKAVTRISSERPTYGRGCWRTASYEMAALPAAKRSFEYAIFWTQGGQK